MTRAMKSPVTRLVEGASGQEYVVTVTGDRLLIRPKRSRAAGAQVELGFDSIYTRALLSRHRPTSTRRRAVSRGLLATERRGS